MAQAMAETIAYVNRSRSFMPQGTVPPFMVRFDTGSVPVGYLVLSSEYPKHRRDPGPGPLPGPADLRQSARGVRAAAVRRQPADPGRAGRPRPATFLQHHAGPGGLGPDRRATRSALPAMPGSRTGCRSCRSTRWSAPARAGEHPVRPGRGRLPAGCRQDQGRHRHPRRVCPGQRPQGRLHPGHQAGRRLDLDGGQRGQGVVAEDESGPASRHRRAFRVRPVPPRDGVIGASAGRACSAPPSPA